MSDEFSSAKGELEEWVLANVYVGHRKSLSKLIAAFVAESVRDDRAKLAAERIEHDNLKKQVREAMDKVSALNGASPFGSMSDLFGAMYRDRR